jgi:hypothetical protein
LTAAGRSPAPSKADGKVPSPRQIAHCEITTLLEHPTRHGGAIRRGSSVCSLVFRPRGGENPSVLEGAGESASERPTDRNCDHRPGLVEVYWMLVGCAFENLLKGVLVRQLTRGKKGNRISEPELPENLRTHDILSLMEMLNLKVSLSRQERDLPKPIERDHRLERKIPCANDLQCDTSLPIRN